MLVVGVIADTPEELRHDWSTALRAIADALEATPTLDPLHASLLVYRELRLPPALTEPHGAEAEALSLAGIRRRAGR